MANSHDPLGEGHYIFRLYKINYTQTLIINKIAHSRPNTKYVVKELLILRFVYVKEEADYNL